MILISYSRGIIENLHAVRVDKRLPAQLNIGEIFNASQNALTNEYVAVPCVVTVPVLVDGEQCRKVGSVHRTPGIHL